MRRLFTESLEQRMLLTTITSLDPPGTGFNDPRPFPGAEGNPATTLGEARINLFNAVLGAWANTLASAIDVDVLVSWEPLFCAEGIGATLAGAGPTVIIALQGGSLPGPTFFHAATAESLLGSDLTGVPPSGDGDVIVFMNSEVDTECLGEDTGFYYGLDGNTPANLLDLPREVVHSAP